MQNLDDKRLLEEFKKNNLGAFEQFFKANQPPLVAYANKFLGDWEASRDIVQEVFLSLWENKDKANITTSLRSYLFTSVRNQCVNTIKHKIVVQKHSDNALAQLRELEMSYYASESDTHSKLYETEIGKKIEETINDLPEQCRITFELSRFEGLKSQEIAKKMEVSVRTVETQIYRALKVLKESLKDYLTFF